MLIRLPAAIRMLLLTIMVAALVIPINIVFSDKISADPGIMKWDVISTPGAAWGKWDINNMHGLGANTGQGSEILDMVMGNDGKTVVAVVRMWVPPKSEHFGIRNR